VSCNRAATVLHGYFDDELDVLGAAEFEWHLAQCSDCLGALGALESLRTSIHMSELYKKAPAPFRKKVLTSIGIARGPVAVAHTRTMGPWLAVAAALLLVINMGWRLAAVDRSNNYETELAAEIVDAHLRSLQPGHLTDVVSTDQHTVKPWFDGKLDFSPPVRDFADQGFPLQGGRIDVVQGRTVAALVYARRKHFVNVFVWPADKRDDPPRSGSRQGYQWVEWSKQGMQFCAVTDAAPSALEQLQTLLASN